VAEAPRRRRRPPALLLALGGAALATGYGYLGLGMRTGPPLVMVGLGGFALVLCALALWRVIDPLTGAGRGTDAEVKTPYRLRELEREKQAVLKAIKEIELDYQMRKINEVDYKDLVERYRARALRVMSDLQAGDNYRALIERELKDRLEARRADAESAGAVAPDLQAAATASAANVAAAPVCADCRTTNDTDAQFCKKCGAKMTAAATTTASPAGTVPTP